MSAVDRLIRAGGVQGSASAHLSAVICGSASDGAATIGNACACLNAGFSRAFLSNLFIIWSRFNNPAGRQIVSRKFRRNSVPGCLPFLGLNAIGLWPISIALWVLSYAAIGVALTAPGLIAARPRRLDPVPGAPAQALSAYGGSARIGVSGSSRVNVCTTSS